MPHPKFGKWINLPPHPGFWRCISVRQGDYKWSGLDNKVYRFVNGSHVELPCNEVTGPLAASLAANMSAAARAWWSSVITPQIPTAAGQNPDDSSSKTLAHSLVKPTFYLGLGPAPNTRQWNVQQPFAFRPAALDDSVTNILAMGAHERTEGVITLTQNGAVGFKNAGDRLCWKIKVLTAGSFDATIFYTSAINATFTLAAGSWKNIVRGTAASTAATLPAQTVMIGRRFPSPLHLFTNGTNTEACLTLVKSSAPGIPIFKMFANLRVMRRKIHKATSNIPGSAAAAEGHLNAAAAMLGEGAADSKPSSRPERGVGALGSNAVGSVMADASRMRTAAPTSTIQQQHQQQHYTIADPAPSLDLAGTYNWLQQAVAAVPPRSNARMAAPPTAAAAANDESAAAAGGTWEALRRRYNWPEGQYSLASMWSPYDSEDISDCEQCQPRLW